MPPLSNRSLDCQLDMAPGYSKTIRESSQRLTIVRIFDELVVSKLKSFIISFNVKDLHPGVQAHRKYSKYICMSYTGSSSSTAAVQPTGMALPLTGTIETFGLPMIDLAQTTPSVAGSTEGLSAVPLVTSVDGPLPLPLLCP